MSFHTGAPLGHLSYDFLEDCLFFASSVEFCRLRSAMPCFFFNFLGLTVNVRKSFLEPTKRVMFLGVVLDSAAMTTTLTSRRKEHVKKQGLLLLTGIMSFYVSYYHLLV